MSRTLAFAVLSTLVLSAGACKSTLGPSTSPISASRGADDPSGDNRGVDAAPHFSRGADDLPGDDRGGAGGGADDPAGHM